jgi:hypothetical protein
MVTCKTGFPQVRRSKSFAAQPTSPCQRLTKNSKRLTVVPGDAKAVTQKACYELPGRDWRAVSSAKLDHQMLHGFSQLLTRMKRDFIFYNKGLWPTRVQRYF